MPEPLLEEPPQDRWCDLVLTGGVASGVVYPWAIVELARKFRFRNLGGTSVGAMAATIAAACEYGRRNGNPTAFEVMRQLPVELAKPVDSMEGAGQRTKMLSLFQPSVAGQRLFELALAVLDEVYREREKQSGEDGGNLSNEASAAQPAAPTAAVRDKENANAKSRRYLGVFFSALWRLYGKAANGPALAALVVAVASMANFELMKPLPVGNAWPGWVLLAGLIAALALLAWALILFIREIARDLKYGLVEPDLGLCRGTWVDHPRNRDRKGRRLTALVDWMHEGVQRAAGLTDDDAPLTFEELWHAPLYPGGNKPAINERGEPAFRSINLEMVTTNLDHGRPYNLPLNDKAARLFFDPVSWKKFFPKPVIDALIRDAVPYLPLSNADPSNPTMPREVTTLLELPSGKMPIVVAARMSLSFPLLFATVPLYAIDYEIAPAEDRGFRKCRFSDGGLCSNFPVHFFDSALPRWPTFGLWLEPRSQARPDDHVVLPAFQGEGWGDSWQSAAPRGELADETRGRTPITTPLGQLGSLLAAAFRAAKDWRDMTAMRQPHMRRRVARIGLQHGEGELNIGMAADRIIYMAGNYGTRAGLMLCDAFAPKEGASGPTDIWREHLAVRLQVLLDGLQGLLKNIGTAASAEGHTESVARLLGDWEKKAVISSKSDTRPLSHSQSNEVGRLVQEIAQLEAALAGRQKLPQAQKPISDFSLRPRL